MGFFCSPEAVRRLPRKRLGLQHSIRLDDQIPCVCRRADRCAGGLIIFRMSMQFKYFPLDREKQLQTDNSEIYVRVFAPHRDGEIFDFVLYNYKKSIGFSATLHAIDQRKDYHINNTKWIIVDIGNIVGRRDHKKRELFKYAVGYQFGNQKEQEDFIVMIKSALSVFHPTVDMVEIRKKPVEISSNVRNRLQGGKFLK